MPKTRASSQPFQTYLDEPSPRSTLPSTNCIKLSEEPPTVNIQFNSASTWLLFLFLIVLVFPVFRSQLASSLLKAVKDSYQETYCPLPVQCPVVPECSQPGEEH